MYTFSSKKDWWVVAFIVCMSGLLIQLLLTMQAKGTMQQYPVHTAVYVLTVLVLWWPFNTRYQITETHLNIRSMFVRWHIPLAEIQHVNPSQDLSAAPALSIKRLKIEYVQEGKAKFVMVSPKDQQVFLKALGIHK